MKDPSKIKHVSQVSMDDSALQVKKPFKITNENKRRFIRLEISSPVWMKRAEDCIKEVSVDEDDYIIEGTILNISIGGMLVELKETVTENDIVLMQFTLQEVETLSNVLGLVKRVEKDEDCYLIGIEFISREYLKDKLSQPEIDLLSKTASHFEEKVQEILSKYLYRQDPDQRVE